MIINSYAIRLFSLSLRKATFGLPVRAAKPKTSNALTSDCALTVRNAMPLFWLQSIAMIKHTGALYECGETIFCQAHTRESVYVVRCYKTFRVLRRIYVCISIISICICACMTDTKAHTLSTRFWLIWFDWFVLIWFDLNPQGAYTLYSQRRAKIYPYGALVA